MPKDKLIKNIRESLYKKCGVAVGETLPAFAWPGGYPLFYFDEENNILCPKCANRSEEYNSPVHEVDVNYEDPSLHCDNCSKRIESAYAEDDAPSGETA